MAENASESQNDEVVDRSSTNTHFREESLSQLGTKSEDLNGNGDLREGKLLVIDSDCEGCSVDDDTDIKNMSADELMQEGKELFRSRQFETACDYFSRALEKKVVEVGDDEFHPILSKFYLWFGDALLTKEEQSDEMFQYRAADANMEAKSGGHLRQVTSDFSASGDAATCGATSSSSSLSSSSKCNNEESQSWPLEKSELEVAGAQTKDGKSGVKEKDVGDEEMAFEMLEMAKKCLQKKLDAIPQSEVDSVDHEDAMDLSFAFIRLADMELMNGNFSDSVQDYQQAVNVRTKFRLPNQSLLAPLLSLSQATYFSGKKSAAVLIYERTLELAERVRDGILELPEGIDMKAVCDTIEDLGIQIADIRRQIEEEKLRGITAESSVGSQSGAKDFISQTTSNFDQPQLANSVPSKRIAIRPLDSSSEITGGNSLNESGCNEHTPKKRRIDIKSIRSVPINVEPCEGNALEADALARRAPSV